MRHRPRSPDGWLTLSTVGNRSEGDTRSDRHTRGLFVHAAKVWEAAVPGGASSSLRGDFPADVWAVLAMMIQAGRVANLQQVS